MNSDFSRVLSLLRKERNISQKKAAEDLGVSQGLLSHYEKGKRECGLDFLVKAANYYSVSCDYLLGRSPEPAGKTISIDEIPEEDPLQKERLGAGGVIVAFNKKLIVNSLNVLFSLLQKCSNPTLIKEVSSFLMLSIYQMFRIIFSSNPKNDENFFTVSKTLSSGTADAAMNLSKANATVAACNINAKGKDSPALNDELIITTSKLSDDYPIYYSSIVNLIKNSEAKIHLLNNSEK